MEIRFLDRHPSSSGLRGLARVPGTEPRSATILKSMRGTENLGPDGPYLPSGHLVNVEMEVPLILFNINKHYLATSQ